MKGLQCGDIRQKVGKSDKSKFKSKKSKFREFILTFLLLNFDLNSCRDPIIRRRHTGMIFKIFAK